MVKLVAAISVAYVWVVGTCVLLYWSNAQASWSNSAIGAVVNGVVQWFTSAGNWMIQTLW